MRNKEESKTGMGNEQASKHASMNMKNHSSVVWSIGCLDVQVHTYDESVQINISEKWNETQKYE